MAYSISASIEFKVPSTICSTIGSTSRADDRLWPRTRGGPLMLKHPRLSSRPKRPGLRPGRESWKPVNTGLACRDEFVGPLDPVGERGVYWFPARRKPGVAGLAWPG